jgi:hypothetical protein
MQNKPSSKAISVATGEQNDYFTTTIACEDGSVWEHIYDGGDSFWTCILEAPTQPKSDLPEVGSRWRGTYHEGEVEIEKVEDGRVHPKGYSSINLKSFLNNYEPIPTQSDNKEVVK